MKTYTDADKFFAVCMRYVTYDGKLEDMEEYYQRTQQLEFQLPEWKRFNLSIHAAAGLDPDVDFYETFFNGMKAHDAVCWWLIFHAEDRIKYNKNEPGYLYYDILDKAENDILKMRDAKMGSIKHAIIQQNKKAIELTKSMCNVEEKDKIYAIRWRQQVSGQGKLLGTGSFMRQEHKGNGNWSDTLKKRIQTRREKGKERRVS